MLTSEMITRIRYNVEDPNSDIYVTGEVEDAMNDGKDQVVALVQIHTDNLFLTSEQLIFPSGTREATLTNSFQTLIYAESASGNGALRRHSIKPLQNRPEGFNDDSPYDLYFYSLSELAFGSYLNNYYVGRYNTEKAETITVWGFLAIGDLASGSVKFTDNIPLLFDNLIIVKATIQLLSSRTRDVRNWLLREQKLEYQMMELLKNRNRSEPRMVHYVDDDER